MGLGRAPCCEKVGLNRGAWTHEEDIRLIAYIRNYGHENWRALPKQAGLLRCGKSCRLRWLNYLRPDVRLGNFTKEEEDTVIHLHGLLGNKWSKIASSLPGRTDNEIKNVWNTHLKKRLKFKERSPSTPTAENINATKEKGATSFASTGTTLVSDEYRCHDHPCNERSPEAKALYSSNVDSAIITNLNMPGIVTGSTASTPCTLTLAESSASAGGIEPDINHELWDEITAGINEEGLVEENQRWLQYLEMELGLIEEDIV